uniref:Replication protein A 32 kDa subunit n=1 Tax=Lingulaulax polyedra TaxID=160621 RepID=A0A516AG30_LINPO|nr:replication protein A 32 kDa subunit [Lingulodinium polyedra]|mmetsp:Transcript_118837/g.369306  ORF Transcript_118837/g.369306 Transcript_118837/m.369306 type:complete len:250 (+) Transcript_118837:2-751(+)
MMAGGRPRGQDAGGQRFAGDRNTCLAVTVRSIQHSAAQAGFGSVKFFGTEQGMLVLVGVVEAMLRQPASMEFSISDGTGRIAARYYIPNDCPKDLEEILPGKYISVFGNVRSSPTLHFAVTGMRPIKSADEVSYHMIEAVHTALKLRKGIGAAEPATPAPKRPAPAAQATIVPELSPPKHARMEGQALRAAVLAFVQKEGAARAEGAALAAVCEYARPVPAEEVRGALLQLVEDGDIFTTVDDVHFQCV